MKEFSVLISVYAREQSDYLRSALHSVFEQTVPPTEVVLVEDGPLTTELEAVITDFCEKYNTLKIVKLMRVQKIFIKFGKKRGKTNQHN